MNLAAWMLGSAAILIQHYSNYFRETDLKKTLIELSPDFGIPRILEYDYIIVGGGTAGCLLASRLSEKHTVLLLEKGGDPPPITYPLAYATNYASDLSINDAYTMIPQENCFRERVTYVGRMLGGTGSHNANIYNRGSPHDYDNWANLTNDDSWAYKNLVQHYKKLEDFVGWLVNEKERDEYGSKGPIQVTTYLPSHLNAWLEAGKEFGYPSRDPNGGQIPSFTTSQVSMRNGLRDSSYTAFIQPIIGNRKTLKVLRYSEVDKVLLDKDGTAYGVAFKRHGIPQIAHARREVILSAGVFASPIILIKSGVGPKELLRDAGIDLVSDLPGVGKNLWDHPAISFSYRSEKGSKLTDLEVQTELKKFHSPERQGIFSKLSVAQAFLTSSRARKTGEEDWADIHTFSTKGDVDTSVYSLTVTLSRISPKSVGEMFFNVTAYRDGERDTVVLGRPDFKDCLAQEDVDALDEGILIAVKVYEESEAFKGLNLVYAEPFLKACESFAKEKGKEFWKCFVRQKTNILKHNAGTCKMGRDDDKMAVVDSKLRVRGVQRLRVIDASIMPQVVNANTNAATLVIAEKMGTEILQSS